MNLEVNPWDNNLTLVIKQIDVLRRRARETADPEARAQLAVAYRNYRLLRGRELIVRGQKSEVKDPRSDANDGRLTSGFRALTSASTRGSAPSRRVLIVASHPTVALALSSLCRALGFSAVISPDGLHALMRMVLDKPDLVIFDADAAAVDLPAVLHRYGALASIPIVALVSAGDRRAERFYRSPGVQVITKPATRPIRRAVRF